MKGFKHFFAEPPIDNERLRINGVGVREIMPPVVIDRPMGTGDYLFMYFHDRVMVDCADGRRWRNPGRLVVWRPDDGHYYGNNTRKWCHSWLHCQGSMITQILAQNDIPLNSAIAVEQDSLADECLLQIHQELTQQAVPDEVIVGNLLENWMRCVARIVRGDAASAVPGEFLRVKNYIECHYSEEIKLADLAKSVYYSVPHFCSEFKRFFGCSAIAYAVTQRLHHARYLLRDTNLRVGEIASKVGYQDIYYFSRHFKKRYGMSPRAMRRSMAATAVDL